MTTPPPGWYSDPQTARLIRWWDGEQWTAHTHLATSSGPPAAVVVQQEAPHSTEEATRGWISTAAKIAGVLFVIHLTLVACDRLAFGAGSDSATPTGATPGIAQLSK